MFVLDFGEKKGLLRGVIEEQRKGTSSWVWLGPASLNFFLEGIERSFKEPKGRAMGLELEGGRQEIRYGQRHETRRSLCLSESFRR